MNNPILFLIFNRPEIAKRTFMEIAKAKPYHLYIAGDGARENKVGEAELVAQTRKITELVNWQCEVKTLFQEKNLGCGLGVSTAISWFFENEEQGIILEDDCLPNQSFFRFCDELLEKYKDDDKIATICGFNYQNKKRGTASYYFSDIFECCGWATWKRTWKNFKLDVNELDESVILSTIKNKPWSKATKSFWLNDWQNIKEHKVNSWAVPFLFCCLSKNLCHIMSNINLISNIGFGGDSTHTSDTSSPLANTPVFEINFPLSHPKKIEINIAADEYTAYVLAGKRNFIKRIKNKLKKYFSYILK